jgi:hypothetical protein
VTAGRPVPHPQLEALARELDEATNRARTLADRLSEKDLHRRPLPMSWSAAECLAHLNLTSERMLPRIEQALVDCSATPRMAGRTYRRDFVGWMLSRVLEPPYKQKFTTTPAFVPTSAGTKLELLETFGSLQAGLLNALRRVAGLDMHRVKVTSAFNDRIRYNLYSAFRIIAAHQRRHLFQAEIASSPPLRRVSSGP